MPSTASTPRKRNLADILAYALVLWLVIKYRYGLLVSYAWVYTDSDQAIMWEALKKFSEGLFHEPLYYGQNYNTFFEALVALPFYRLGMPVWQALPLATTILCVFPFVLLSWLTLMRRSVLHGLIILSIPLLLPHEYGLISSMPRGFVTGMFFAGFTSAAALYPGNKWWFAIAMFSAMLAYIANSNAMLVALPSLLYLFISHYKQPVFYLWSVAGLAPGIILLYGIHHFYTIHPYYQVHELSMEYSLDYLKSALRHPVDYFGFNTPLFHYSAWALFGFFLTIAIYFAWQKKITQFVVVISIPLLVLATLGISKLSDATHSLYFHYSRMFIALPLSLAFCLSLFKPPYEPPFFYWWCLFANVYTNFHIPTIESKVEEVSSSREIEVVLPYEVKRAVKDCGELNRLCEKYNAELVITVHHFFADLFTHGCGACEKNFPPTLKPDYERRAWRLLEDEEKIYTTILIIDLNQPDTSKLRNLEPLPGRPELLLLRNNRLKTTVLLDSLGIPYRRYK